MTLLHLKACIEADNIRDECGMNSAMARRVSSHGESGHKHDRLWCALAHHLLEDERATAPGIGCLQEESLMTVDSRLVSARVVQTGQRVVDVNIAHVSIWIVGDIGRGCLLEEGLWWTERRSRSLARWG